jgi:hypothetical protein
VRPILLALFVTSLGYFTPDFGQASEETHCPDGLAYRVTEHPAVFGRYVPCERFDEFFQLLSKDKITEASGLLVK